MSLAKTNELAEVTVKGEGSKTGSQEEKHPTSREIMYNLENNLLSNCFYLCLSDCNLKIIPGSRRASISPTYMRGHGQGGDFPK